MTPIGPLLIERRLILLPRVQLERDGLPGNTNCDQPVILSRYSRSAIASTIDEPRIIDEW